MVENVKEAGSVAFEEEPVVSPCVRNCCLDNSDICMGCYRHLSEITAWQSMPNTSREDVLSLCQTRKQDYNRNENTLNWLK